MIELKAPEGFRTNQIGDAFPLADGTMCRKNSAGYYELYDEHESAAAGLVARGWRLRSDIEAERKQALEAQKRRDEREAEAKALTVAEILEFVKRAGGELEVRDNKLYARNVTATMRYVLRIRQADLLGELSNRGKRWEVIE